MIKQEDDESSWDRCVIIFMYCLVVYIKHTEEY